MRFVLFTVIFLTPFLTFSQDEFTISGSLSDSVTSETLPGAMIFLEEDRTTGGYSDAEGNFSLTAPAGTYTLVIQYMGYKEVRKEITLNEDLNISVKLPPESVELEEIQFSDDNHEENVESTEMGVMEVKMDQVKKLPKLMGETDPVKTLQLMPGVQSGGEGISGFYVRGGGPDQNLVLLDDAVVYNTGHLLGFFSVFNTSAIDNVVLHKGNMPASYGGRLSSVVDFTMREGNYQEYHGEGSIGLISSRLAIEGPIIKNKSSFMISGRRTYVDLITKPFINMEGSRGVPYYFFDLNGKFTYKPTANDEFSLSGYAGDDDFTFSLWDGNLQTSIMWGNRTATAKWAHHFNENMSSEVSLIYNRFRFSFDGKFDQIETSLNSNIEDVTLDIDYNWELSPRHNIKAGTDLTYHTFTPRRTEGSADSVMFQNELPEPNRYALDWSIYVMDIFDITERLRLNIGLRYTLYSQIGPFDQVTQTENGPDTTSFGRGEEVVTYGGLEPRAALRYKLNMNSSVKAAFNVNNQYIHLASLTGNSLPFDLWIPSSAYIKPQRGWQASLGYFRNFGEMFEFSLEGYYKKMQNQIAYQETYVLNLTGGIEQELSFGEGWSYGAEVFLKKRLGKLSGWIGYTLSWTQRRFPEINNGEVFPAKYDRRHDLSLVAIYEPHKNWTISGTFVYATGMATTMPESIYFIEGRPQYKYTDRNEFRMQPYNRLDLSVTYEKAEPEKRFHSSWTFSVYNIYNRKNPYMYYFRPEGEPLNNSFRLVGTKVYIFPVIPSLTWNFYF